MSTAVSISDLTDDQLLSELHSDSLLNRVRRLLASSAARIEQTYMQRHVPNPVALRRMEFEMAEEIIHLVQSEECVHDNPPWTCAYVECIEKRCDPYGDGK